MAGKIPVVVVAGPHGTGQTSFLSRYLKEQADGGISTVVIMSKAGMTCLDHTRVEFVGPNAALRDTGCVCCSVQGPLVETLRSLFFQALSKSIPPFTNVIVAPGAQDDPAAIRYTLQYERFLQERYRYAGCLTLVDAVLGRRHLRDQRGVARQVVLADVLALNRAEQSDAESLALLKQELNVLNPFAVAHDLRTSSATDMLVQADARRGNERRRPAHSFGTAFKSRWPSAGTAHYETLRLEWSAPLPRSAVARALEAAVSYPEIEMLRLSGAFRYLGSPVRWTVDGVHQVVYPNRPEPPDGRGSADPGCELILTFRPRQDGARQALVARLLEHLPNAVLSGDDNLGA